MKNRKKTKSIIYHLFVIAFGYIMIYPLLWMVFSSFKDNSEIFRYAHILLPQRFNFENFIIGWKGFGGISFSVFFKNSFILSIIGTLGAVTSSALIAYGFARNKFKGKKLWFGFMIATMLLPYQVVMIPQYIMFNRLGWVNTFKPLLVPAFLDNHFLFF